MGMLGNIFSKIFPSAKAATPAADAGTPAANAAAPAAPAAGTAQAAPAPGVNQSVAGGSPAAAAVDVEEVLNGLAAKNAQKLNWRTSIVDLLKLLDLDSSLTARKELAQELQYSGDMGDSAAMNIWLHRQVMNKLAANGGKVPADLKD